MSSDDKSNGPKSMSELIPKLKGLPSLKRSKGTRKSLEQRLFDYAQTEAGADPSEILYQHSVLCQTCLPYRDPGEEKTRKGNSCTPGFAGPTKSGSCERWEHAGMAALNFGSIR